MDPLTFIILIFSLFALSRAYLRVKDRRISWGEFGFWGVVWVLLILVAIFPWTIASLAALIGIGRGVDLVIYVSIPLVFYLVFRLYVKIDAMERNLTELARAHALREKPRGKK
ncbi:MAG: DUF2304 family protein [Nitrosarchaeum sp.]|nr:DUF2304 family protein [Nitrosarchaeum sp.]